MLTQVLDYYSVTRMRTDRCHNATEPGNSVLSERRDEKGLLSLSRSRPIETEVSLVGTREPRDVASARVLTMMTLQRGTCYEPLACTHRNMS